jgi:hypothetical protein
MKSWTQVFLKYNSKHARTITQKITQENRRGNQKWTIQRHCNIKNTRDTTNNDRHYTTHTTDNWASGYPLWWYIMYVKYAKVYRKHTCSYITKFVQLYFTAFFSSVMWCPISYSIRSSLLSFVLFWVLWVPINIT